MAMKLVVHADPQLNISYMYVSLSLPPPFLYISLPFPFSSLSLLLSLPPFSDHHPPPYTSTMADRSPPHQLQVHPQQRKWELSGGRHADQGPSASKILAVVTLVPVGGALLGLSGLTLAATLFGLAISTPVFLLFSPVIVPAAVAIFLAIMAFMTSGVFGLTALSSLSWVYRYVRRATGTMPEQMEMAKRRMQDMAGFVGQKTKDVGQEIQGRAQEGRRTTTEQHERRT